MPYDFNRVLDRRGTNSIKWHHYPEDVLPLWVADMDFPAPEPVQEALRRAVEHGIFGYESPTRELCETVTARMDKLYGWQVSPEMVVATPGVIAGFNAAARTVCTAGQGILVQPPVYPPFLSVHKNSALLRQDAPLRMTVDGANLRYAVDFEVFERAVNSGGARTGMFLLCNPQRTPAGQLFDLRPGGRTTYSDCLPGPGNCQPYDHAHRPEQDVQRPRSFLRICDNPQPGTAQTL
jgi:cystathionine beta-lyase